MTSDTPINSCTDDLFGRCEFAERISEIIVSRAKGESFVIGIHAPWGEGKSSVVNMVKEKLSDHLARKDRTLLNGDIVWFEFNPWRYGDEDSLLRNYFSGLAESAGERIATRTENLSALLRKYSWIASPLEAVKISALGLVDLSLDAEKLLTRIADAKSVPSAEKLKQRIENVIRDSDKSIVVVMDDIDRLDKHEIKAVFRLVKLMSNFPNTVFVLAFDPIRVAEALGGEFGSVDGALAFLEKIVQLSLPLPPLTVDRLIDVTFSQINELLNAVSCQVDQKRDAEWSYFFRTVFGSQLKSPRSIKKYINGLSFSLERMQNELDVLDLMTLEASRVLFPKLYHRIRDNKEVFLVEPSNPFAGGRENDEKYFETLREFLVDFPPEQHAIIKKVTEFLFPRTSGAFSGTHHGREWHKTWNKQRRIASPAYFHRYFEYGISNSDISDETLVRAVSIGPEGFSKGSDDYQRDIQDLIKKNPELFLDKLSFLMDDLNEVTAITLAKVVAQSGDLFPKGDSDSRAIGIAPFSYAGRVLRALVEKTQGEKERFYNALQITHAAQPLDLAYEFFIYAKYIGVDDATGEPERLSDLGKAIVRTILDRIKEEVKKGIDLDIEYPEYSANLYRVWAIEDRESMIAYLSDSFQQNPERAVAFVLAKRGQAWDVNSVATLFGMDFIVQAIQQARPNLRPKNIIDYRDDMRWMPDSEDEYLRFYLGIASKRTTLKMPLTRLVQEIDPANLG